MSGCAGNDRYEQELGLNSNPKIDHDSSSKTVSSSTESDIASKSESELGTEKRSNDISTISYPDDLEVEPPSKFEPDALSAVWIEPEIESESESVSEAGDGNDNPTTGTKLSIPLGIVEKYWIIDFYVNVDGKKLPIMAVKTSKGDINIMPRICVPCRSEGWHLKDDVLICDACGTTFDANTGGGISGACKNYPKALIPYENIDGKIVFDIADVKDAYTKTLSPNWP